MCNVLLQVLNTQAEESQLCYIDFHNDAFFGLARGDCALVNTLQKN